MMQPIIAIILFLFCGWLLYRAERKYFWYIAVIYLNQLWAVISCAYIETGIFVSEQNMQSFPTGATWRLVLYNSIFFLSYIMLAKIVETRLKGRNRGLILNNDAMSTDKLWHTLRLLFLVGIGFCTLLLYYNLLQSGIPLLSKGAINKFNFWLQYAKYPKFERFAAYSPYFGFALGFIFCFSRRDRSYRLGSLAILGAYVLYQVLAGNKFSQPFTTVTSFLIPFIWVTLGNKPNKPTRPKLQYILLGVLGVGLIIGLATYYESLRGGTIKDVVYRIFGLQGHVWWRVDYLSQFTKLDYFAQLKAELSQILYPVDYPNTGIFFLTALLGGDPKYAYIVAFTMGYPAIALFSFGPWALVAAQAVCGVVVACIALALNAGIRSRNLLSSVLLYRLLSDAYTTFTMGNYWQLFNSKNLVIIFLVIICNFLFAGGLQTRPVTIFLARTWSRTKIQMRKRKLS